MATKEPQRNVYVGHRYVPMIMGEWDQTFTYEGLSIVLHQGNSYTSTGRVPVGIPITDEKYWKVTGNYNAQIEQYRQDVIRNREEVEAKFLEVEEDKLLKNSLHPINIVYDLDIDHTGVTDVTTALNNALVSGNTYFFPEGSYLLSSKVSVPENVKLISDKAIILTDGFRLIGSNIEIEGFTFQGAKTAAAPAPSALLIDGGKNITIHKNTLDHTRIYANYFHPDNIEGNLRITDNTITGNFTIFSTSSTPRPITIHSYSGVIFSGNFMDCKVKDESLLKFQGIFKTGADGVNYIGEDYSKRVLITNNVFKGVTPAAISLYSGTGEAVISDNIFELGTAAELSGRIIDGKSTGTDVNTNKIRNITITDNVVKGYFQFGGIRISGGYGMAWEGDPQVGTITNNVITNYYNGQVGFHIEVTGFHKAIITGNIIDQVNTVNNYNDTIGVGGVKSAIVSNNMLTEGSIQFSNTIKNTANQDMIGKMERAVISGNLIERFKSGAIHFKAVTNAEIVVSITGNHLMTDTSGSPPTYPILTTNTPNLRTVIATGNIGHNSANLIAGSRPNLVTSTIGQLIDVNNTWNV